MRGDKSVKNFIENMKKGKTMMYHASGMIIGCAGSGKTTLLERLKGIDLEEIKQNINSTRGIDIHTDVFDVTDNIRVNSSLQRQRFKISLDERSQQGVPENPVDVTDDVEKRDTVEPVAVGGSTAEATYKGQVSHDETKIKNTSSHEQKGAPSPESTREDSQDFPSSSELYGTLQVVAKHILDDPEKKITITDFAGQCAYYASHQIFLSPRAFFILVLNMEKKFDDKVGEEVCYQEGSVYKGWTHRDYLEFWMKSIHEYSSDKAPILLVGTHSEDKTEEEKRMFFREIWKTLEMKEKTMHKHLDVKRQFAVGFHDNETIEKIKLSIVDVVCRLDHWGEELPQSWAMFEKFFQEKKNLKIFSKSKLLAFNEALPQGIKLHTPEDMNVMLQFFHDIREILYFDQEILNEIIILDVQWFADAFKNVITDKNHAEEDLFEFASEWDQFNETGELNANLLCAIWKMKNSDYIEHKDDIMLYMEKLGLLAKMGNKKWYVPCMNKIPFPVNYFSSYPASSILCYTFGVLPAGIFHRLVATCMQIPWEIFSDKDQGCIYQTAAILVFHDLHHNILLGMTQKEIQLQVFVAEGEVDISACHQIRERIENELHNLSNTFQKNSEFHVAFKCKPTGFCDSNESAVINESKFARATFQCPSCPANQKHTISTKDITRYWKQVPEGESRISRNESGYKGLTSAIQLPARDNSNVNMEKIRRLLQVGTDAVRICFDKFFPKEDLQKTLKANETDMRRGTYRFQPPQLEILFPTQGGSNVGVSSLSMDVTIMYKLLRNYSDITPPGNGWGKEPKVEHITESDDIERIRLRRNKYAHDSGGHHVMKDDVFKVIWTDLSQAIMRLSGGVLKRRIQEIHESEFTGSMFQCPTFPLQKDIAKKQQEFQLQSTAREDRELNPSLELILNAVSRKVRGIGISIFECLFEVNVEVSPALSFEEKIFRVLYQWKSKNPHIDHLSELERILQREGQGVAAEYVRTFKVSDFTCSGVASPSQTVLSTEFRSLSEHLSKDYTHFVRFLGLPHRCIEQMEADGLKIQEKIYISLSKIQEECHYMPSREKVCEALTFIDRNDVKVELGWISHKRKLDDYLGS